MPPLMRLAAGKRVEFIVGGVPDEDVAACCFRDGVTRACL